MEREAIALVHWEQLSHDEAARVLALLSQRGRDPACTGRAVGSDIRLPSPILRSRTS